MARLDEELAVHDFTGVSGTREHYLTVEAPPDLSLAGQIDAIAQRCAAAMQALRLTPDSAVFRRLYLSDAPNQATCVGQSNLFQEPLDSPVAVSIVQQPPLPGGKVAMMAYHLPAPNPIRKRALRPEHLLVEKAGLAHLWSTRLCASNARTASSTAEQTQVVFDQHGLTRDTRYVASTGIEGACSHRYDTVLMDAYSILGLAPAQVAYLTAHDRLCDTKDDNVTFERGTRVAYADRAHHFISGSTNIDPAGQVMHVGDVARQAECAVGNVAALLHSGGARLADITHLIVYLRDPSDHPLVEPYFAERFPGVPRLVLRGAVCRPEWLVEVEGVAITPHARPELPAF